MRGASITGWIFTGSSVFPEALALKSMRRKKIRLLWGEAAARSAGFRKFLKCNHSCRTLSRLALRRFLRRLAAEVNALRRLLGLALRVNSFCFLMRFSYPSELAACACRVVSFSRRQSVCAFLKLKSLVLATFFLRQSGFFLASPGPSGFFLPFTGRFPWFSGRLSRSGVCLAAICLCAVWAAPCFARVVPREYLGIPGRFG